MSWMPAKDPVLGDKQSCDALDLIIVPRVRDLGDNYLAFVQLASIRLWLRVNESTS
jgi:hypothetical protein